MEYLLESFAVSGSSCLVSLSVGADNTIERRLETNHGTCALARVWVQTGEEWDPTKTKAKNTESPGPIIDIPDLPVVFDSILRFVYPVIDPPEADDLPAVATSLSAADKYNITSIFPALGDALKPFTDDEPFKVYILACRFGFLEEAKAAARVSTPDSIILPTDDERDIRQISGVDPYRSLWLSKTRGDIWRSRISNFAEQSPDPRFPNKCQIHWDDYKHYYAKLGGASRGIKE